MRKIKKLLTKLIIWKRFPEFKVIVLGLKRTINKIPAHNWAQKGDSKTLYKKMKTGFIQGLGIIIASDFSKLTLETRKQK